MFHTVFTQAKHFIQNKTCSFTLTRRESAEHKVFTKQQWVKYTGTVIKLLCDQLFFPEELIISAVSHSTPVKTPKAERLRPIHFFKECKIHVAISLQHPSGMFSFHLLLRSSETPARNGSVILSIASWNTWNIHRTELKPDQK